MVGFMFEGSLNSFVIKCSELQSNMSIECSPISPSLIFSNTGKGGIPKYFSVTLLQLIGVLGDIKSELPHFINGVEYIEKPWRDKFSSYIKDPVVNALSTVQTLPLYCLINKVICITNKLQNYTERSMPLTDSYLSTAIEYLQSQQPEISLAIHYRSDILASNIIYYGAPGTGKSHTIDEETKGAHKVVTVFHPDTQYSDFVGSLKPKMEKDTITYQFRPGPFTNALIKAYEAPSEHVYLVIEEINRASAAAVFGELFQLLDRQDGASKYAIDATDLDMLDYINSKLSLDNKILQLNIPSNLSLLATMNSSDQAVMPMDTAFKRRWSFKYIEIDFNNDAVPQGTFCITTSNGKFNISWSNFAQIINDTLIDCSIPEDRLLGPFFLTSEEIVNSEIAKATLSGKLFVYLWDDVLRNFGHEKIFSASYKTFGRLSSAFNKDKAIFNKQISDSIEEKGIKCEEVIEAESETEE
ncbi:hypothetical protein GCM10007855_36440 [Aliivibrio sifiae]|uniref:ATPase dynein-related AAA domain-containing protein n=2 Tax=Aliivibrio sifiae TaxID=566293 RepID=A0ABQ6AS49_9GAMM|nr:hypothetical protein GCM10007855_36440 [Aliivibrio sifiae]